VWRNRNDHGAADENYAGDHRKPDADVGSISNRDAIDFDCPPSHRRQAKN
jgi:hypothetical protein